MKILGPVIITLIFSFLFSILIVRYSKLLKSQDTIFRILLIALRTATILFILLLLLNPWFQWSINAERRQKIAVVYDRSESVAAHFENSNLNFGEIKSQIDKWAVDNKLDIENYQLGERIYSYKGNNFSSTLTDFTDLTDLLTLKTPHQLILISDGVATSGKDLAELDLPANQPIHTLGVGPLKAADDIELASIDFPETILDSDTVALEFVIKSRLANKTSAIIQIKNKSEKIIFISTLVLSAGTSRKEVSVSLPAQQLAGTNTAEIIGQSIDIISKNNTMEFRIEPIFAMESILLISGALSPNTHLLKKILSNLPRGEVDHRYKLNSMKWNKDIFHLPSILPKIVVLDNFPAAGSDKGLFIQIVNYSKENAIPLFYFAGPNSDLKTAEIISSQFPKVQPLMIENDLPVKINTDSPIFKFTISNSAELPPLRRNVKWLSDFTPLVEYNDGSLFAGSDGLFNIISFPEFSHTHFRSLAETPITGMINYLFRKIYLGNDGLLALNIKGSQFNLGEKISTSVIMADNMGLELSNIIAVSTNGDSSYFKQTQTDKDSNIPLFLFQSGEYSIFAKARNIDGSWIFSKKNSVFIRDINIEFQKMVQNRNALMALAEKTSGTYLPIESLDSLFSHIDITPVHLVENHQISGISTQNYWWLIILFLTIEWYYRKKLGLL